MSLMKRFSPICLLYAAHLNDLLSLGASRLICPLDKTILADL